MPTHKRNHDSITKDDDPELENDQNDQEKEQQPSSDGGAAGSDESDQSLTSLSKDEENELEEDEQEETEKKQKNEYVVVKLAEIRKEVQCPICLGIIRKTRTVMECLHRFCRECIDKSMRLGNNECPSCRTHCASRRSLRDDPNYDALIAALYPDIDKYEEEELAFHEEEQARNKQIQASIAQTIRRQAEALSKKRTTPRGSVASATRRSTGRKRDSSSRGRRTYRTDDLQGSDENEDANGDGGKDSSSAGERNPEIKPKRQKRGARSAPSDVDGGGDENESEVNKESMVSSAVLVGPSERLAWGKGGIRSHTRYGNASAGNGKNGRHSRIFKLAEYLKSLEENDNQVDIRLMLVSLDEQNISSLQQPYLCCKPTLLVKHLCQYIALRTAFRADEVEIYLVKELNSKFDPSKPGKIDPRKDKLQVLQEEHTLGDLVPYNFTQGHVLLAYKKLRNSKL